MHCVIFRMMHSIGFRISIDERNLKRFLVDRCVIHDRLLRCLPVEVRTKSVYCQNLVHAWKVAFRQITFQNPLRTTSKSFFARPVWKGESVSLYFRPSPMWFYIRVASSRTAAELHSLRVYIVASRHILLSLTSDSQSGWWNFLCLQETYCRVCRSADSKDAFDIPKGSWESLARKRLTATAFFYATIIEADN